MSLLDTASKLLGFLRWSGEKYSTSSDIRAHPAQVYLSQYLRADCSTLGQACSTGSCSIALHMCRNKINTAQGVCTGWSLSVLMNVCLLGIGVWHCTYPLLLLNALGDHGLILAIQCLYKQVVLPCPLQLCSVDDLPGSRRCSRAVWQCRKVSHEQGQSTALERMTSF